MQNEIEISVVVPLYCCAHTVDELVARVSEALSSCVGDKHEIILVNDGSPMEDWAVVSKLMATKDYQIVGVNLSRNFGQHFAITAGLDHARGKRVVVMDGDLQDVPEEIPKLYQKMLEGYDIVYARRSDRQDSYWKKKSSKLFYKVFNYLTGRDSDEAIANFSIVNENVVRAIKTMPEKSRMYPLMLNWLGFDVAYLDVQHAARTAGKSSYSFKKLVTLGVDNILSNSNMPLRLGVGLGFIITFLSIAVGLFLIIGKLSQWFYVEGWVSTMVSIWFVGGVLSFNMGLLGIYIGKVYDESKGRPLYVVKDVVRSDDENRAS